MYELMFWEDLITRDMIHPAVGLAEKMIRPVVVYVFLVVLLRVFGKRELAQLNPFDLVVLLLLSNTVQNAIIGNDTSLTGGLIGAATLCAVNYLVVRFLFRHRRLDQIIEGRPVVLVENGTMCKRAMRRELLTRTELLNIIHRQGFASLDEVERCVLEPGGTFYVLGKEPRVAEREHIEVMERLDQLRRQLDELGRLIGARESSSTADARAEGGS